MSVGNPDLLISELGTIRALSFDAFIVCNNLTTLHHEAWDDALEDSIAVVQVETKLASAEKSEILDCTRHLLLEKLHYDALLLIALLSFCPNLHVHIDLDVAHVEGR